MQRRTYLRMAGSAGAAVTVAGCAGNREPATDDGSTPGDGTTEEDETATATPDETAAPAETETPTSGAEPTFEVVAIDTPESVEIGDPVTFSITVENTGGADGTWTQTVSGRIGDGDWGQAGTIELDVPAGETATWESDEDDFAYQTTVYYRLEEAEREFSIDFVAADLSYGEEFVSPEDVAVVVEDAELTVYYEYEDYDGSTAEERAPDDHQWAFVHLRAENRGDEAAFTPLSGSINVIDGSTQYDSTYISRDEGEYDGGEVEPGIVREGWLAYEIPDDLDQGDFDVSWRDSDVYGEWAVRWSG